MLYFLFYSIDAQLNISWKFYKSRLLGNYRERARENIRTRAPTFVGGKSVAKNRPPGLYPGPSTVAARTSSSSHLSLPITITIPLFNAFPSNKGALLF